MSDSELPDGSEGGPMLPAGTEAPAWVAEALASLRADDPPLPDDVAERIDRALAVLGPADVLPAGAGTWDAAATSSSVAAEDDDQDRASATVVPIAARDRRAGSPGPWGHRLLLGGVAAAAALVLGGLGTVAVVRNSGSSSTDSPGVSAEADGVGAGHERTRYVASNQDYTSATLDTTAQAVLAASTTPLDSGPGGTPAPPATSVPGTSSPAVASSPPSLVLRAATDRPTGSCVDSLAGAVGVDPLLVDEARYEQRPAYVVVIPTTGEAGTVDVWVVARTCTAGNEGVLAFARIAR